MKMFNKINMASEYDVNKLKTGIFYNANGEKAAVEDGALVSIKELENHDLYANTKDMNARKITAFDENYPIYGFVDYVGVAEADVLGVRYRVGDKIAGLGVPAGESTRVRMVDLGDEFYLGNENFATAPTVSKFAVPTNGSTVMTPANAMAASGLVVAVEDTRVLITGQVNEGSTLYRCRVVQL